MFPYIETSQLICRANQLTGFYMMRTLVVKGLKAALAYRCRNTLTLGIFEISLFLKDDVPEL